MRNSVMIAGISVRHLKFSAAAVGFLLMTSLSAPATEDFGDAAKVCANEIALRLGCVSCSGRWAEISMCAALRAGFDPQKTQSCIAKIRVSTRNLPMSYDRIAAVESCAER